MPQLSFSKLLSHTFPGIFIALGIFMMIDLVLFHNHNKSEFMIFIFQDWKTLLVSVAFLIFLGTIFGVVIDSIHHMIESKIYYNSKIAENGFIKSEKEFFKDLKSNNVSYWYFVGFLPLEKIQYLNDEYYSYLECDTNLGLSFLFSAFVYPLFLVLHGYTCVAVLIFIILIILSAYCFYSGYKNYFVFYEKRVEFVRGALDHLDEKRRK